MTIVVALQQQPREEPLRDVQDAMYDCPYFTFQELLTYIQDNLPLDTNFVIDRNSSLDSAILYYS